MINESKPTSFPSFKRNSLRVFDLETLKQNGKEKYVPRAAAFIVQVKNNPQLKSELVQYETANGSKILEQVFEKKFLSDLQLNYPDLKSKDLEIIRYRENDPRLEGNKVKPNVVPTNMQRVSQYAAKFRDKENVLSIRKVLASGSVTVDKILDVLNRNSNPYKYPYYKTFLGHLIARSGRSFEPVTLVDDLNTLKDAGFVKNNKVNVTELINDFGEVAGPVGLICGSINGNAVRMFPAFMRSADGKLPSIDELKQEATIHFHASQGHMLVDSYIEFRGKVVRCSSKNAAEALSGGQGASTDGIFKSLDEIAANPEAHEKLQALLASNPGYNSVLDQLRLVSKAFDPTELNEGMNGYVTQFKLLAELNGLDSETTVTDHDIAILKEIWDAAGNTNVGMNDFKFMIGAALGNRPDIDQRKDLKIKYSNDTFTPQFANILRTFNLNRYGEPGISGTEKYGAHDDTNAKRGWWKRVKKALVYNVSKIINKNKHFSDICTWILNHGAFCQIDTRYKVQRDANNSTLIITNISATWPSTAVDSVKLVPLPSTDGFRYKLDINGGRGFDDDAYKKRLLDEPNDLDYDFGFNTQRDRERVRKAMLPTLRDLARHSGDWSKLNITAAPDATDPKRSVTLDPPKFRGADRTRDTRAILHTQQFYTYLNKIGAIDHVPDRDDVIDKARTALELGLKIIDGYSNKQLIDGVRFTINALWGMRSINENDEEDDDDGEDLVRLSGDELLRARERAARDATVGKTISNMLYLALRVNAQLNAGNTGAAYKQLKNELETAVKSIDINSWSAYNEVLKRRESGAPPTYTTVVPVAANATRASRQRAERPAQQPADDNMLPRGRGRPMRGSEELRKRLFAAFKKNTALATAWSKSDHEQRRAAARAMCNIALNNGSDEQLIAALQQAA